MADQAAAQQVVDPQYRPAQPTISPYVGLLQTNTGPIPNYFSLVRPRLEQQAINRQLQRVNRVQSMQIQAISGDDTSVPVAPQTGKSAGFLRYMHYYPAPPTSQGRRQ